MPRDDGGAAVVHYEAYSAKGAAVGDLCVSMASAAAARAGWSGTLAEAALSPFAAFIDSAAAVAAAVYVGVAPFVPFVDSAAAGVNASITLRAQVMRPAMVYYVKAVTVNAAGLSSAFGDILVVVPGALVPDAPLTPALVGDHYGTLPPIGATRVTVRVRLRVSPGWSDDSGCAVTKTSLLRWRPGAGTLGSTVIVAERSGASSEVVLDAGRLPGMRFNYSATRTNGVGASTVSALLHVTTPLIAPLAPLNEISVTQISATQLNVKWTMPLSHWGGAVPPSAGDTFGSTMFNVAFVMVSSASGVVDNLEPEWFTRGTVRAAAFNATLLAPATDYAIFIRARNSAGVSNWTSPPTMARTADALPCPGAAGAGPCSGRGECHAYKGTCTCAAGYCGLGCDAADGMQIVLDVVDDEMAEYSPELLVAGLAQSSVLNVSAQRLAVTHEHRSGSSTTPPLSAADVVRVSLTLRFVDRSAMPSVSDSVDTVSQLCTALSAMAGSGKTAGGIDRRLAALRVVRIALPHACDEPPPTHAHVDVGVCSTIYNTSATAAARATPIARARCNAQAYSCISCYAFDHACGWCGDESEGTCMVGSGAGPAKGRSACRRVLPISAANDGLVHGEGMLVDAAELAEAGGVKKLRAWYAPAADNRCPTRCGELTLCGACTAQRDRAMNNMPQCGWCATPWGGSCQRNDIVAERSPTRPALALVEVSKSKPGTCVSGPQGATWTQTCQASCGGVTAGPQSAVASSLDGAEGFIALGGVGVSYPLGREMCTWKIEPRPTNWYDELYLPLHFVRILLTI